MSEQIRDVILNAYGVPRELCDSTLSVVRQQIGQAIAEATDRMIMTGTPLTADVAPSLKGSRQRVLCSKGCCFECESCAAKPGSPVLCKDCLELRALCAAMDKPAPSLKEARQWDAMGQVHYPPLSELRAKPQRPRSWLDETMGSGHPCPEHIPLRMDWKGQGIYIADAMWVGWSESKEGEWTCRGGFRVASPTLAASLDGEEVIIFNLSTDERFRATVEAFRGGLGSPIDSFGFRSVGLPDRLITEANPAHTLGSAEPQAGFGPPEFILCRGGRMDGSRIDEPAVPRVVFPGYPQQLYVRDGDVMQYQGDCDDHGNLLTSDADTPAEPQADEPHKVQWREWI